MPRENSLMKKMIGRIRNKRDTAQNWMQNNPVLLDGEIGIDDFGRIKVGDGTTPWTSLQYINSVSQFRIEPVQAGGAETAVVSVDPNAEKAMIVEAVGDFTLNFEYPMIENVRDAGYFAQKHICLFNGTQNAVQLAIQNANWAASPGNGVSAINPSEWIYIYAVWIGGRVVLELKDIASLS